MLLTTLVLVTMIKVALRTCFWPGFSKDITAFSKSCEVCQVNKSFQFPPVKLQVQDVVDIRVMDRIQCDWGEKDGRSFHLIVDHCSLFLWCQEFKYKTTQNTLAHVMSVIKQFGRPLECLTDRGPSYRMGFEDALEAMGVSVRHSSGLPNCLMTLMKWARVFWVVLYLNSWHHKNKLQ